MNSLYIFLIYAVIIFLVLLFIEFIYRKTYLSAEITRKIAHIGSGIIGLTFPLFIDTHWVVFGLALVFSILLLYSKYNGFFPSIFNVKRKSIGELLFVWDTWLLFLLYKNFENDIYFYLPYSVVVFADSLAAVVGKSLPVEKYRFLGSQKSLGGSMFFFVISMFFTLLFMPAANYDDSYFFLFVFVFSVVVTFVEAISFSGFDNMSVPVVAVIMLYFYFNF